MRSKATLPFLKILLLLLILYPFQIPQAAEKASVQQILANPDAYDGKEVLLEGKAAQIRLAFPRKGNVYATFTLFDDSGKGIKIFVWGRPKIEEGQRVAVTGVYWKVKKVVRYTFYNEVEAKEIK